MAAGKRFTIEEASILIPRLEMLIERMQRAALVLRSAMQDCEDRDEARPRTMADVLRLRPDLAEHARDLEGMVREIEQQGCYFKGLDLGLVDFPAELEGAAILLCWQYGEKQIAYWHRADEGFAGRRPLTAAELPSLQ